MKLIILKIIDKIAKKYNSNIIEVFSVFYANIVLGNSFENVLSKNFNIKDLNKNEIEILKDFFDFLKNDSISEIEEFKKNLCKLVDDFKIASTNLVSFFLIFLPKDAIFSKDSQKIRNSLNYSEEINDAIIKALEFLSMLLIDIDRKTKCEIFKNIIDIILILGQIVVLGEKYES